MALVSGEFHKDADQTRIVSWPLMPAGQIAVAGRANQKEELVAGKDLVKFQGVAMAGQTSILSSSYGNGNPAKRFAIETGSPPNCATTVAWPTSVEDLFR